MAGYETSATNPWASETFIDSSIGGNIMSSAGIQMTHPFSPSTGNVVYLAFVSTDGNTVYGYITFNDGWTAFNVPGAGNNLSGIGYDQGDALKFRLWQASAATVGGTTYPAGTVFDYIPNNLFTPTSPPGVYAQNEVIYCPGTGPVTPMAMASSGGSTSGDPHIFPLRGNAYELPNKCCAYRMVQGKNLVVNANTRAVTQAEEHEIQAYYKQVTGEEAPESLVTNGVFYENVFIQSEGHVLEYSFDKKAGSHDAYFQVEQKEGKSTRTGEICPTRNYASVTFTHSVHGKTTIELNHFANPQLKHGMSCQFTRTTGLSGLLIEESNCKTMRCGLRSTKNVYGKGTNQLKNKLVLK